MSGQVEFLSPALPCLLIYFTSKQCIFKHIHPMNQKNSDRSSRLHDLGKKNCCRQNLPLAGKELNLYKDFDFSPFLAHLSRRLIGELIVYQWLRRPSSVVCRPSSVVRQHFQTSSPLKPLGQLNSYFIWRLLRMGERKFVQMVLVTWPRWPPCPYMVKTLQKSSSPEPEGRWPWDLVCSIRDVGPTKFVQMMILGWPWPT